MAAVKKGQGLIEYGLVVVLIAVASIVALNDLSSSISRSLLVSADATGETGHVEKDNINGKD